MGCDFSFTSSLEFSSVTSEEICSFSDVNYLPDQKYLLHFDQVRELCQNKNYQKAQQIGDAFFSKHAIVQAISVYQHIIESDPKYGLQQLQGLGSHQLAMSYYEENVWKFYVTHTKKSIYDALSLCYLILSYSQNEYLNALGRGRIWYKRMLEKNSSNIGFLIGQGNLQYNMEYTEQPLELYEKAREIYDGLVNIHVMKALIYKVRKSNKQKAIQFSKKVLEIQKDNQYAELIITTYHEDLKQRIDKLEQLHKKYPTYNRILTQQGADYCDLETSRQKAIQCYANSVKNNPFFYKGYNNLSLSYRDIKQNIKALDYSLKAIQCNKHFGPSYNAVFITAQSLNMNDQTLNLQLEKYPKIKKDWFWMKFAQTTETKKPKQTQKILFYYQKAVQGNPKNYIAWWLKGKFQESRSMSEKALQSYKDSYVANPQFYRAYYNLGLLNNSLGYQDQAIKMYEKTIEVNPRYSAAYHNIADIYLGKEDYQKAQHYFSNAVKFEPDNSIYLVNIGVCYFRQSKYKQARKNFLNVRKYLDKVKRYWGNNKVEQIQKILKNVDIDNDQKWDILEKSTTISDDQKERLKKIQNEFAQKLKRHEKTNVQIKMPLQRIMNPDVFEITKAIYDCHFGIVGLPKTFPYVMKLFCQVDQDYFHIVPLFVVQFFLRSIYEFKVDPETVEKDTMKYMKEIAAMVAEKQKEVNESGADATKENSQANVNFKNIKIELTDCKPLNKQINIFKEAAYFDSYEDLYAQIDKANTAAKPSFSDFALLVEQVRTKAKGLPGGISMKIPSKSQDQFKVIMRIMQKMFKKQIDADRVHKTIFNIYARIVHSNYDQSKINEQIIEAWNYQITKILQERRENKIETQCFVSDLIRAKCVFNTVEDLANAVKVADSYCKMQGYQIIELDNRLAKPQTKDVVLKIQIRDAVCEFQLAMPQSAKLFHLDHCVYEIIRSPLGCVFGSYLFISKQVKYPLAKNCEDMFIELSKSKDMMDKINKMYPQYVRNALTKQWTILGRRKE